MPGVQLDSLAKKAGVVCVNLAPIKDYGYEVVSKPD